MRIKMILPGQPEFPQANENADKEHHDRADQLENKREYGSQTTRKVWHTS